MNQCKDCKWWQWEPENGPPVEEGWRFCKQIAGSDTFLFHVSGMHTEGFMETSPDFGCLCWETQE
jgi:hypothetical protein